MSGRPDVSVSPASALSPPRLAVSAQPSAAMGPWQPAAPLSPGLYLVATPIGNLGDISARALETLAGADIILCEDTRTSGKLLGRFAIKTKRIAYHEHNADALRPQILDRLGDGQAVALISDAGTPLINDPGYKLVRACQEAGLAVTAVPGPCAAIVALTLSGLPTDRFFYAGFPPPKSGPRRRFFAELGAIPGSLVFLESPRRLAASLADMEQALGDRPAAVARELTKLHEELRRDRLTMLAAHYAAAGPPKGEVVVVVGPAAPRPLDPAEIDTRLAALLAHERPKDAAVRLAAETGLSKRVLYNRALELRRGRK